jgi:hypothetical protein
LSEIRANTISDAAGTGPIALHKQSAAKAWVNFNGSGTIAVRDSVNVASLTDNSTGQYAINFTNATATADYSAVCGASAGGPSNSDTFVNAITFAVGSCTIQCVAAGTGNSYVDRSLISSAIHGDLA